MPFAPCSMAVCCMILTAHCLLQSATAAWQGSTRVSTPRVAITNSTTNCPSYCGSASHHIHSPVPPKVVLSKRSPALIFVQCGNIHREFHTNRQSTLWQCCADVPVPTTPCGVAVCRKRSAPDCFVHCGYAQQEL